MHIVAFSGSPRKNGNSVGMLSYIGDILQQHNITFECIKVGGALATGCNGCTHCLSNKTQHCVREDTGINEWYGKICAADGVLLATPSYASNMNGDSIAFLQAMTNLAASSLDKQTGRTTLTNKVGAAFVPTRRSGGLRVVHHLNNFFVQTGMIIPMGNTFNVNISRERQEYLKDEAALENCRIVADNMIWLLKKLHA